MRGAYILLDKIVIILSASLMLVLSGCIPSLHPLYTDEDLISESQLIGKWVTTDGNIRWVFRKSEGKGYELIYTMKDVNGERTTYLEAHLLKLHNFLFLDFYPLSPYGKSAGCGIQCLPVHTFARIELEKNSLSVMMPEPAAFEAMIRQGKVAIPYERVKSGIVITASTKELQDFVLKYAEDRTLFLHVFKFYRQD